MIVFLARDIPPFVMYCVNGKPRSSLYINFIESTDSMICPVYTILHQIFVKSLDDIYSYTASRTRTKIENLTFWRRGYTMAMTHGSVGVFDSAEEEWDTYVEQVELYLATNKITDAAQKRDVLLSVCGAKTYHILRNLLAPTKPTASTYMHGHRISLIGTFQTEAGNNREALTIQLSLSTTWRVRLQVRGRTAASSHRVRVRRLAQRDAA